MHTFRSLLTQQEGQSLAEYAIIVAFVVLAAVAAVTLFGLSIPPLYNALSGAL